MSPELIAAFCSACKTCSLTHLHAKKNRKLKKLIGTGLWKEAHVRSVLHAVRGRVLFAYELRSRLTSLTCARRPSKTLGWTTRTLPSPRKAAPTPTRRSPRAPKTAPAATVRSGFSATAIAIPSTPCVCR